MAWTAIVCEWVLSLYNATSFIEWCLRNLVAKALLLSAHHLVSIESSRFFTVDGGGDGTAGQGVFWKWHSSSYSCTFSCCCECWGAGVKTVPGRNLSHRHHICITTPVTTHFLFYTQLSQILVKIHANSHSIISIHSKCAHQFLFCTNQVMT